jgi:hypothetical protein
MARLSFLSGSMTYGVGSSELLLCGDDATGALSGVECGLTLYDSLSGSGRAAASTATDLGDLVPASGSHCECVVGVCRGLRVCGACVVRV